MNTIFLLIYLHCTFQHSTFTCSFRAGVGLRFVSQVLESIRQSSQHAVTLHRFLGENKKFCSCMCLKNRNMLAYFSWCVIPRMTNLHANPSEAPGSPPGTCRELSMSELWHRCTAGDSEQCDAIPDIPTWSADISLWLVCLLSCMKKRDHLLEWNNRTCFQCGDVEPATSRTVFATRLIFRVEPLHFPHWQYSGNYQGYWRNGSHLCIKSESRVRTKTAKHFKISTSFRELFISLLKGQCVN